MSEMDHQELVANLRGIILPILEAENIELVELNFFRVSARFILRILVDKKEGSIDISECARLNEKIGRILEERNIIRDRYTLEVSSPGLDRPLSTKNDFLRCINRKVRLLLSESIRGKMEIRGAIVQVKDDAMDIDTDGQIIEVALSKINKAEQIVE